VLLFRGQTRRVGGAFSPSHLHQAGTYSQIREALRLVRREAGDDILYLVSVAPYEPRSSMP
jgi:hypothetical protein